MITLLMSMISMSFSSAFLIVVNYRRSREPPLPDMVKDISRYFPDVESVDTLLCMGLIAEGIIVFSPLGLHDLVIVRRIAIILSAAFIIRTITNLVTSMPDPNPRCLYDPGNKIKITASDFFFFVLKGKTCGDMLFSGHMQLFLLPALVHSHYKGGWFSLFFWVVGAFGGVLLVISRLHYTVDVLLTCTIFPPLFWIYHAIAENPRYCQRLPWAIKKFFQFMEWEDPFDAPWWTAPVDTLESNLIYTVDNNQN